MNFCVRVDGLSNLCEGGGLEDLWRKEVLRPVLAEFAVRFQGIHTVIISVFDGGDGSTRGGRSERSRESGDLLPEEARERNGDGMVTCIFAAAIMCREQRCCVVGCCGELLW